MEHKFKIGDRVKIKDICLLPGVVLGSKGIITRVMSSAECIVKPDKWTAAKDWGWIAGRQFLVSGRSLVKLKPRVENLIVRANRGGRAVKEILESYPGKVEVDYIAVGKYSPVEKYLGTGLYTYRLRKKK